MPNIPLDILADFLHRLRDKHPLYLMVWANILADWAANIEPTIEDLTIQYKSDDTTIVLCIGFGIGLLSKMGVNVSIDNNKLVWDIKPRKKLVATRQRTGENKTAEIVKYDTLAIKQKEGLWPKMISIYQDFLKNNNLPTVGLQASSLKHLKSIKEKLNERSVIFVRQNMKIEQDVLFESLSKDIQGQLADKIEKAILYSWKAILDRWNEYDEFVQKGKNLGQINYNFNNIFDTLQRNGKTIKEQKNETAIEKAERADFSELSRNRQADS